MKRIRILIADDYASVREGMKALLGGEADLQIVGEAENGRVAVELAKKFMPDLILMDLSMPELNGFEAARQIKNHLSSLKILTITRHTDASYLRELLEIGVSGYILKQNFSTDLIRAIRTVASGDTYLDASMPETGFDNFSSGKNPASRQRESGGETGAPLSEVEQKTLRLIALGYSNREIAEKLDTSANAVKERKADLLQKLNISSRKGVLNYALREGWIKENQF